MPDPSKERDAVVDRRLSETGIIWLTTVRADGQPQSVPVWFLWDSQTFLIYSQPNTQKLRNIRQNPRVALNLNTDEYGQGVIRVEGTAEIDQTIPPATEVPAYLDKYRRGLEQLGMTPEQFAQGFSVPIRVRPVRFSVS